MSELKPCPFCGKPLHVFYNYRLKAWTWHCDTENCAGTMLGYDSEDEAVSALNRRAQPDNEPLTLAQLREMDGEPVWTVNVSSTKDGTWEMWDIVEKSDDEGIEFGYSTEYKEWWNYNLRNSDGTLCGCSWLAYCRPPERSENDG